MESPSEKGHADFVVEALESDVVVVTETALPSKNSKTFDDSEEADDGSRCPPDD